MKMPGAETNKEKLPYSSLLVPVIHRLVDLKKFLKRFPGFKFCIYIADKNKKAWTMSTSRKYLNQVLPGFIYIPFNIKREDNHTLKELYKFCQDNESIVAINQAQPHVSNPVLFELYPASPLHVDALIRNKYGKLKPMGLEGPAFTSWFKQEVGHISEKTVICFGVGSTGEGIVYEIMKDEPRKVYLIDIRSKVILASDLGDSVYYLPKLEDIEIQSDESILFVFTLNKELEEVEQGMLSVVKFMKHNADKRHIFVDIRPHLKLRSVDRVRKTGWIAYTGSSKTARNNYVLLEKITRYLGIKCISYDEFHKLAQASS